jgi:hypothetical protein
MGEHFRVFFSEYVPVTVHMFLLLVALLFFLKKNPLMIDFDTRLVLLGTNTTLVEKCSVKPYKMSHEKLLIARSLRIARLFA